MKSKLTLLFAFLLGSFFTSAQVVDVLTGISEPFGLTTSGNEIFVAGGGINGGYISKFDASQPNPVAETLVTGVTDPRDVIVVGDELFFIDNADIKKINITETNPIPVIAASNIDTPTGLAFYNGEMYVSSESTDKISKFDISQSNPTVSVVVDENLVSPQDMVIKDGILYVAEFIDNQISKIDLNAANPLAEVIVSVLDPVGVEIDGDYLYYTSGNVGNGLTFRINLNDASPNPETVVSNLNTPRLMTFYNGELFITSLGTGKVVKATSISAAFADLGTVCSGGSPMTFGGASPTGGTYTGNGVTDSGNGETFIFDPTLAGMGMIVITYTAPNGQTASANIIVSGVEAEINNSMDVSCAGGMNGSASVSSSTGMPPFTYSWSNGGNTAMIENLPANSYSVTVTDGNGCTDDAFVTISEPSQIIANPLVVNVSCNGGNDGLVNLNAMGGTPPYNFNWSGGSAPTTAGAYSVTITDNNGCTITSSATITEPSALSTTATPTNVSCNGGNDGSISLNTTGGTPPYNYFWNGGSEPIGAGNYMVTVTDGNGCTEVVSATITEPTAITVATSSTPDDGTSNGTATANPMGGIPPYAYNWSNGGVTQTIENLAGGTYEVTITDANNCTSTASVEVESNEPLEGDNCEDAVDINNLFGQVANESQVSNPNNNTNYTAVTDPELPVNCFFENDVFQHTQWFEFTGDGETYHIRTINCNTGNEYLSDSQIAIFDESCSAGVVIVCNEDEDYGQGLLNGFVEIETVIDQEYHVLIDGYNNSVGEYCIEVTRLEPDAVTNISQTNIEIFPNPTTGELQFSNINPDFIEVFDNTGKQVKTFQNPTSNIDISELATGFYFLKFTAGEEIFSAKIIKE